MTVVHFGQLIGSVDGSLNTVAICGRLRVPRTSGALSDVTCLACRRSRGLAFAQQSNARLLQQRAEPGDRLAGERSARAAPSNPPRTPMTNTPDQLDLEGRLKRREQIADLIREHVWEDDADESLRGVGDAADAIVMTDETESLKGRLRASEAECERLRNNGHHQALRARDAEALATAQAETIRGLTEALSDVRKLIAEGAMSGFNPLDGNWADRLYISQRRTTAALSRTPSGEARPDAGSDGGEGV